MKKSEAKKRKKKVMLIATLSTAAIIVGGLTFAWYTSQDSVTNTFKASGNLKTVVVENFTPPTNWQPGVTTDKVVQVTNTGTLDAYTRVTLEPTLEYDLKDEKAVLYDANTITTQKNSGKTLFSVNKEAIEDAVEYWNGNNEDDQYVDYSKLTDKEKESDKYAHLVAMLNGAYMDDVTLYVKASDGTTTTNDGGVVESGWNYEFMGYLTTADGCYEIEVNPRQKTYTDSSATDGFSDITSTLNSKLKIYVYPATHYSYSCTKTVKVDDTDADGNKLETQHDETVYDADGAEAIAKVVTLNFRKDYENDWKVRTGDDGNTIYYYKNILKSGTSTQPLLESVDFNDSFGDDGAVITNLVFNLNVKNESTQAVVDAAVATFKTNDKDLTEEVFKKFAEVNAAATTDSSTGTDTNTNTNTGNGNGGTGDNGNGGTSK